jgi:hypothetical protein
MSTQLTVSNLPKNSLSYTNCIYLSAGTYTSLAASANSINAGEPEKLNGGEGLLLMVGYHVFVAKPNSEVQEGGIAMNGLQRRCAQVSP